MPADEKTPAFTRVGESNLRRRNGERIKALHHRSTEAQKKTTKLLNEKERLGGRFGFSFYAMPLSVPQCLSGSAFQFGEAVAQAGQKLLRRALALERPADARNLLLFGQPMSLPS